VSKIGASPRDRSLETALAIPEVKRTIGQIARFGVYNINVICYENGNNTVVYLWALDKPV